MAATYQQLEAEINAGKPIEGLSNEQRKKLSEDLVTSWRVAIGRIVLFDDDPAPVYSGTLGIDFVESHEIGFSIDESRGDSVYFQIELLEPVKGSLFPLLGQISFGRGQWLFKLEASGDYEVASDGAGNPLDEGIVWSISGIVLPDVLAPVLSEVRP